MTTAPKIWRTMHVCMMQRQTDAEMQERKLYWGETYTDSKMKVNPENTQLGKTNTNSQMKVMKGYEHQLIAEGGRRDKRANSKLKAGYQLIDEGEKLGNMGMNVLTHG